MTRLTSQASPQEGTSTSLNDLATALHFSGDSSLLSSIYGAACKINPNDYTSQLNHVVTLLFESRREQQKLTSFVAAAESAAHRFEASIEAQQYLVSAMLLSLRLEEVIEHVEKLEKSGGEKAALARRLAPWKANALLVLGKEDVAKQYMGSIGYKTPDLDKETTIETLERARTYLLLREPEVVKTVIMEEMIGGGRVNRLKIRECDLVLDFITTELGAPNLTIWTLQRILRNFKGNSSYLSQLAILEHGQGRTKQALMCWRAIEHLGHLRPEFLMEIAEIYVDLKEEEKAFYLLKRAQHRMVPDEKESLMSQLEAGNLKHDFEKQPLQEKHMIARARESLLLLRMSKHEEAVACFNKLTEDLLTHQQGDKSSLHAREYSEATLAFGLFFAGALDRLFASDVSSTASVAAAAASASAASAAPVQQAAINTHAFLSSERALFLLLIASSYTHLEPSAMATIHEQIAKIFIKRGQSNEADYHTQQSALFTAQAISSPEMD